MKTSIIKWDKSMAVRCIAKCVDGYTHAVMHPLGVKSYKSEKVKASSEKAPSVAVAIPAGEWDGFEYALNNALKNKH